MGFIDTPGVLAGLVAGNGSRTWAAGLDPFEFERVTAGLAEARDWPGAFRRAALDHLARADRAATDGYPVSAGVAYQHAARWFHFATILPDTDHDGRRRNAADAVAAQENALGHLDSGAERVGGVHFAGWLRRPSGVDRPPVVIVVPGLDSSAVEFGTVADELLRRGVATLTVDGPGQGALLDQHMRADYQVVTAEAVDRLAARDDVDAARAGVLGLSLGGYYAAKSAAEDDRLRAVVTVSGPFFLTWPELPEFVVDTLTIRAGGRNAAEEFAARVDLRPLAAGIRQPMLVLDGGTDVIPGVASGAGLAAAAPAADYVVVPAGDHLLGNVRPEWLPRTADWLATRLK